MGRGKLREHFRLVQGAGTVTARWMESPSGTSSDPHTCGRGLHYLYLCSIIDWENLEDHGTSCGIVSDPTDPRDDSKLRANTIPLPLA